MIIDEGAILLNHLCKTWIEAILLEMKYFETADLVKIVKTAFNTFRTQYLNNITWIF